MNIFIMTCMIDKGAVLLVRLEQQKIFDISYLWLVFKGGLHLILLLGISLRKK